MRPNGLNGATQAILDDFLMSRLLAPVALAARTEPDTHSRLEAVLVDYERERLEPSTRVVMANRQTGPERVRQIVVDDLDMAYEELEAVIAEYSKLAGFDQKRVMRVGPNGQLSSEPAQTAAILATSASCESRCKVGLGLCLVPTLWPISHLFLQAR